MAVTMDLPDDLEKRLRGEFPDLEAEVKEIVLVSLYWQDKLTRYELSLALGIGRIQVDGLLKKHNVTEDLPTLEALAKDLSDARKLFAIYANHPQN